MFIILSKILPVFLYPLGATSLLCLVVGTICLSKKAFRTAILVFFAALLLWASSTHVVSRLLMRSLECKYSQPAEYPHASAIVLLGGGASPPVAPRRWTETNRGSGNRIMHAARLFHKGYAPCIIPTGGRIPFLYDYAGSEAGNMYLILTEMYGIDSSRIFLEENARNTHEHTGFVREILRQHGLGTDILLVTSASHMPRSVALFRKAGYTVYPAPTDFWEDADYHQQFLDFLPTAEAANATAIALHEYVGLITYKLMGWI